MYKAILKQPNLLDKLLNEAKASNLSIIER